MYKYHLADVKWKEMYFIDIFDNIYIAKSTDQNKLKVGNVPFIGRSSINNGLQGEYFVEKEKINKGSSLTISMVGEPKCFYHKYSFTCSQNILVLQNNEFINITNSKFLIPIIDNYLKAKGYGYGYPVGKERVLRNKLLLPVDKNNQINWNFMEEYIKERENKQREELKEYYKSRLLDLVVCPEVLNDVDWKEIFIEEVAEIYSGKDIYERERTIGNTPYITATANNNGIGYFVENENKTMESECISVNRNGSVGYAFYHCYEALYGNDTRKLKPFIKNKYTALFITHAITSQKDKYGYGYKMGTGRLKRQKIMLPVSDGEVNYKYMENFIKNIEQKQIKNILKYLDEYIYIYIMYNHFDKVEWKEFFLDEICNINSGVRLTKANMNEGKMPFIGATDSNNGITNFVSNTNKSLDKNVLGVNYNGSVVENFYHPYECIFSDDVKRVSFKDEQGQNKYCYLFLKQMILQQKEKYRYAYKFNGDRMARQKIIVPVDEESKINYSTIENYMRAKELKNIISILKNKEN
ncbi:MAG: restriction endonuclease subunit S [Mogibacterium diversum]|uniref:restriction endonuclease subunit S n=1 Tax=Mogibacterium diversum TaxID=114527 RepID=UPI002063BEB6|nr:restriction endonuclease subunit S [Mogibacterium diversum]UQF80874.1 MAG: restriction endonuclease subunit S [Mogibacterium diversum]